MGGLEDEEVFAIYVGCPILDVKRIFKMHKLDRYTGLDSTRALFHVRYDTCIGRIVHNWARMHDNLNKSFLVYGQRGELLDKDQPECTP